MLKRLIHNTIISTVAFGGAALLGLIVIPVIIRTWGVTEFGLIVLARLLLPTGLMAVLDLGLSEVATQVFARAREHRDWRLASQQFSFLLVLSICLALILSAATWLVTPYLIAIMKVDPAHTQKFTEILHYTAIANLILIPALLWEGIVKGFERYNLLRISEFTSTAIYVALTVRAAGNSLPFDVVAYIYLATLMLRALAVFAAAVTALRAKNVKLVRWSDETRRQLVHRCLLLLHGKLIGGISGPAPAFIVGLLFGPSGVGVYDALMRLSRVSKIVVSLLTSALLPVASRLDERGSATTFARLGELGLVLLPMFTIPPLAAAAVLSSDILGLWIGPLLAPYALWMGLSFLIPICAQYLAIGSVIFLTRTEVQARLNLLSGIQLLIWTFVSAATLGLFAERALILGQVVGGLAVLPWQIGTLRRALNLDLRRLQKAIGTQAVILIVGCALLVPLAAYIHLDSVIKLAAIAGPFCLVCWFAQYFLVLEPRDRAIIPQVGHLLGVAPKAVD
jgi:O-antigen/teichoic acid export membrane protein